MKGSLIGRGTFGDVYLGLNPMTGELMAVKQVELPVVNSATEDRKQSMVDALQREIALLKVLQHENIVQYLGSQSDEAHLNIFLEYVPGGSVAGLLASYGAFQEPLVRSFVKQILRGLCYLHQRDIIHRDIKGANILVDNKGGVKISDFGISKKVEDDMLSATNTGPHRPSLQGSVFWMAPEVVKQTQYTFKADIWSLGCLVVEMFTGDHPFPEYSQMQAMFKIGTSSSPAIPENISEEAKDFLRSRAKSLLSNFSCSRSGVLIIYHKISTRSEFQERPSAEVLLLHPFIDTEGTFAPVVPGNMSTNTLVGF
ncbi:kinase [Endogone sp. FLAS-F59071]|nr:kinase [Endogone sp. FLAS-F59071]|eukprot:RUS15097.1 kinase [Endogone sp. FLAS-F59071]